MDAKDLPPITTLSHEIRMYAYAARRELLRIAERDDVHKARAFQLLREFDQLAREIERWYDRYSEFAVQTNRTHSSRVQRIRNEYEEHKSEMNTRIALRPLQDIIANPSNSVLDADLKRQVQSDG